MDKDMENLLNEIENDINKTKKSYYDGEQDNDYRNGGYAYRLNVLYKYQRIIKMTLEESEDGLNDN